MKIILTILLFLIPYVLFSFSGKGSGTWQDPYQITNIGHFQEINLDLKANYILMNDIDASETRNWNIDDHDRNPDTPNESMGFRTMYEFFEGTLNGNGHIIKNLYINRPQEMGISIFSGSPKMNITKIGFEDVDITCYWGAGFCLYNEFGRIEECFISGSINSEIGISSFIYNTIGGYIRNCYSNCILNAVEEVSIFCASSVRAYSLENCYTTSKIEKQGQLSYYSRIFGYEDTVTACFWDSEATGIKDTINVVGAKGLPTSEMMKRATFESSGWDFDSVWCIDEGKSYPRLRAFGKCDGNDVPEPEVRTGHAVSLQVFPNPASAQLIIKFGVGNLELGVREIEVYDVFGVRVLDTPPDPLFLEGEYDMDVSGLAAGVYYVKVGDVVRKFVKM